MALQKPTARTMPKLCLIKAKYLRIIHSLKAAQKDLVNNRRKFSLPEGLVVLSPDSGVLSTSLPSADVSVNWHRLDKNASRGSTISSTPQACVKDEYPCPHDRLMHCVLCQYLKLQGERVHKHRGAVMLDSQIVSLHKGITCPHSKSLSSAKRYLQ